MCLWRVWRVERSSDVGRTMLSVFRIGCCFLAGGGLQPGQCKQIISGLKNGRAPERETKRRTETQAIFTFGRAMFMSGDIGGTKQTPWRLLRALFVILNRRGNIRSSATLSRGPRTGDAEHSCVPQGTSLATVQALNPKRGPAVQPVSGLLAQGPTPLLAELSLLPARCDEI